MKKLFLPILFLGLWISGCKDDTEDPIPVDQFSTQLSGEISGQAINANSSAIQSTYYADQGESTGALEASATLANGEKLTFFLDEAKAGTITLTQIFPAVMEGNSYGLRLGKGENEKLLATPGSYVKYLKSTNTFFAISGKIVLKIEGNNLTLDWEINFKDSQGSPFTSKGTLNLKDFKSNLKPKAEINNPTSNLSVISITPEYGKAGIEVVIKGTGFSALSAENKVKLGDQSLEPTSSSATEIKVKIPENGSHGKFKVDVLGTSVESGTFYYEPIVLSLNKTSAKAGEDFTITGKHFDADKALLEVKIGTKVMEILSSSLTSIQVKIPAGTESGKVSVARKGRSAIEGPEFTITADPVVTGPAIGDIFEILSGNLTFEEVIVNSHEYGPFWTLEIDKGNNTLYAVGEKGLVSVNLSTKTITKIVNTSSEIYRSEIGIINSATIPQTIFATGDGHLYGIKSIFSLPFSPNNVFKINLDSKAVTMLGNAKFNNGAALNGIYVGANKSIYIPEFTTGYHLSAYDENLGNRKVLIQGMTGALASTLIPMGENRFRLVREKTLNSMKYHEVNGVEASAEVAMGPTLSGMEVGGGALTQVVGLDQTGGNIYGLFGGGVGNVASYPQFGYTLGIQPGASGNFQKKGGFKIKQSFEYEGKTYYVSSKMTFNKIMGVDKDGSIYFLISTPMTSQGVQVAGPLGGIYKVKFQ